MLDELPMAAHFGSHYANTDGTRFNNGHPEGFRNRRLYAHSRTNHHCSDLLRNQVDNESNSLSKA